MTDINFGITRDTRLPGLGWGYISDPSNEIQDVIQSDSTRFDTDELVSSGFYEIDISDLQVNTTFNESDRVSTTIFINEDGQYYERSEIVMSVSENERRLTLHSTEFGALPEEWKTVVDEFTRHQYMEVYNYIDGPGPERCRDDDLISWITDENGEILGILGMERRVDKDLGVHIVNSDPDDTNQFSTQRFFVRSFDIDNLNNAEFDLEDFTFAHTGELTRFLIKGDPKPPRFIRAAIKALLAASMATNVQRYNYSNPDLSIKYCIGNVKMGGGAQAAINKFMDKTFFIHGGNSDLRIREQALLRDDPHGEGYASPYMSDFDQSPRSIIGKPMGLGVFVSDLRALNRIKDDAENLALSLLDEKKFMRSIRIKDKITYLSGKLTGAVLKSLPRFIFS